MPLGSLLAFAGFAFDAGTAAALPLAAGLVAAFRAALATGLVEVFAGAFAAVFAAGFAEDLAAGLAAAFAAGLVAVLATGFAVLATGFAVFAEVFAAGLAAGFAAAFAGVFAADFAAGFAAALVAGLAAVFAAGFAVLATGLAAAFAAGLVADFAAGFAVLEVEAVMTGVSLALVFFEDEVLSAAERRRLDSKPPRFLPVPVSESFFANFMPLDAPTEPMNTVSGITKTHVKSSFSKGRLGLIAIIAVNVGSYAYLSCLAANSLRDNNPDRSQNYSFIEEQLGSGLLSFKQEHGRAKYQN
jgi:MFS family permease